MLFRSADFHFGHRRGGNVALLEKMGVAIERIGDSTGRVGLLSGV